MHRGSDQLQAARRAATSPTGDPAERDRERRRRRTTRRSPALEVTLRGAAGPWRSRPVFPANPLMNVSDASLEGLVDRLREGVAPADPPPARRPRTVSQRALELSPAAALLPALRAALAIATLEPALAPAPAPVAAPPAIRWCVVLATGILLLAAAAAVGLTI